MHSPLVNLQPVFSSALSVGTLVYVRLRTKKGKIKWEGTGRISSNNGTNLLVDAFPETAINPVSVHVSAQHVWDGRASLRTVCARLAKCQSGKCTECREPYCVRCAVRESLCDCEED